jgi:hypothetical protein
MEIRRYFPLSVFIVRSWHELNNVVACHLSATLSNHGIVL